MSDLAVAQHEAAHIVVGVALGLKLRRAAVGEVTWRSYRALGYTWFKIGPTMKLAAGIMTCAGIVWDRDSGEGLSEGDLTLAREYLSSAHDVRTAEKIAAEILASRSRIHSRIVAELCERDLGPRDIERMILDTA